MFLFSPSTQGPGKQPALSKGYLKPVLLVSRTEPGSNYRYPTEPNPTHHQPSPTHRQPSPTHHQSSHTFQEVRPFISSKPPGLSSAHLELASHQDEDKSSPRASIRKFDQSHLGCIGSAIEGKWLMIYTVVSCPSAHTYPRTHVKGQRRYDLRHEMLTQRAFFCIDSNTKKGTLSQQFMTHVAPPLVKGSLLGDLPRSYGLVIAACDMYLYAAIHCQITYLAIHKASTAMQWVCVGVF